MASSRYTVLERLEAGGMAEVFRGKVSTVEGIEKLVAIKRILPRLTRQPKFIRMFLDEARLAMQLDHANIVHVFDIGQADGTFFLVMEYVEGTNLKHVVEEYRAGGRRLGLPVTLYVMSEVCKALAYAHERKDLRGQPLHIVHRDISPPNILLSRAGEVKLADFGLAKAHSQLETTDPGIVKGKFSYLSPEAAHGEETDTRADIFAVGTLLWELITGRPLFLGDSDRETLDLVRRCRVPGLAGTHRDVGAELASVVAKALTSDPDQRWQSARELGDQLIRYLFARGLKVSSEDVTSLVRQFVGTTPPETPISGPPGLGVVEHTVRQEMALFQSLPESPAAGRPDSCQPRQPAGVSIRPQQPAGVSIRPQRPAGVSSPPAPRGTLQPPPAADSPPGGALDDEQTIPAASVHPERAAVNRRGGGERRRNGGERRRGRAQRRGRGLAPGKPVNLRTARAAFEDAETVRVKGGAERMSSRTVDLRAPTIQRQPTSLTRLSAVPWWVVLIVAAVVMILSSAATYFMLANSVAF